MDLGEFLTDETRMKMVEFDVAERQDLRRQGALGVREGLGGK
jgi:hypothetical protein